MYPLILQRVLGEEWCILPEVHHSIQDVLFATIEAGGVQQNQVMTGLQVPFTERAAGVGLTPPSDRASRLWTRGSLGVIPVRGVIGSHMSGLETMCGGYDVAQLQYDLESASEKGDIKRVLIDFHSPGGTITGVPEAAKAIKAMDKPTFGFTNGMSASASYWLMSQCDQIYTTESGSVGSIGVYMALLDKSEAMKARGEQVKLFKAGKYKAQGHPGVPLTAEDEQMIQDRVNKTYGKFTAAVRSGRTGVRTETMQGQMFTGADARDAKLVDSLVSSLGSLVKRLS